MEFKRYEPHTTHGDVWMAEAVNGDYVPYQEAQAALEQLNSVNTALEKHFGPASIAEVSQYVEVYRTRIAELEAQKEMLLKVVSLSLSIEPGKILEVLKNKMALNLG